MASKAPFAKRISANSNEGESDSYGLTFSPAELIRNNFSSISCFRAVVLGPSWPVAYAELHKYCRKSAECRARQQWRHVKQVTRRNREDK
ncbi:hypothetical protein NPIL_190471 [Nephila pilipes]|uniref:Uncharacterized protein n=1 Tax=Nephila pilipes TaxID=299642 RepID=A0A8X6MST0_NEPPI|nr:hypothetical protein NPIL_190471 [Nephila pilipes]